MAEKKEKKRWSSTQRLARERKRTTEKPDKIRWKLHSKKIKEIKEEHKKKRKARKANRNKLIEKGVIKKA
jgi:hypothetical protein